MDWLNDPNAWLIGVHIDGELAGYFGRPDLVLKKLFGTGEKLVHKDIAFRLPREDRDRTPRGGCINRTVVALLCGLGADRIWRADGACRAHRLADSPEWADFVADLIT